ncbi:hypothetical protein ACTMTP_28030 [Klebsiella pneumoniae]
MMRCKLRREQRAQQQQQQQMMLLWPSKLAQPIRLLSDTNTV